LFACHEGEQFTPKNPELQVAWDGADNKKLIFKKVLNT
jgi:hypothetical protein